MPSPHNRTGSKIALLMPHALAPVAGVILLAITLAVLMLECGARSWPTTEAHFSHTQIYEHAFSDNNETKRRRGRRYAMDVMVAYTVAGQTYEQMFKGFGFVTREEAQSAAADYPRDVTVIVWYDPDNPAEARVDPSNLVTGVANVVVALIFLGVGLLIFWKRWKKVRFRFR